MAIVFLQIHHHRGRLAGGGVRVGDEVTFDKLAFAAA
jgi:hypothetical protein